VRIKAFDEQINTPFNNQEFAKMIKERGEKTVFDEVRRRLMTYVLPAVKTFLDSFK